jgi:hypothetical protein
MNNALAMSASHEAQQHKKKAAMITALFAAAMTLLMFLWKWDFPRFEKITADNSIEVELNLPPDPPMPEPKEEIADGGGGGGNPVQAAGDPGIAPPTTPAEGDTKDSKDIEEDDDKEAPPVTRPVVAKPKATTITNTSVPKAEPKPIVETPAPQRPKAVLGKTTTGSGRGGGAADDYDRAGGRGTGIGVGNGSGTGGGNGTGNGGGNGSGRGVGSGPKVTSGDRKIVRSYSFQGDLDKATIYANVNVSPEGVGRLMNIAKGSSSTSNAYKEAVIRYLENIRFDKSDHESVVTVRFNFTVN